MDIVLIGNRVWQSYMFNDKGYSVTSVARELKDFGENPCSGLNLMTN